MSELVEKMSELEKNYNERISTLQQEIKNTKDECMARVGDVETQIFEITQVYYTCISK